MIYVFIVDTSASMNQIFSNSISFLDCAKNGVEHFFKWEMRRSDKVHNKYMLVTYEELPKCYKSGLMDSSSALLDMLKPLTAHDQSSGGQSLHAVFEYLNLYRFQAGLETVGQGRYPAAQEAVVIVWLTDGRAFSSVDRNGLHSVTDKLLINGLKSPGSPLYLEPFRWDQKLLSFVLSSRSEPVNPELIKMTHAMNGDLYCIDSVWMLQRCIENCMGAQKPPHPNIPPSVPSAVSSKVFVLAEELPTAAGTPSVFYKTGIMPFGADARTFPIPEGYWVDGQLIQPPPRSSIPQIAFSTQDATVTIPHGFPFDRFHIDQEKWLERLSERSEKKSGLCWMLYVRNSSKEEGLGQPFGFFKVSTAMRGGVSMYVLPYNFPRLFKMYDSLMKHAAHKTALPPNLKKSLDSYISTLPIYYLQPLRNVFVKLKMDHFLPPGIGHPNFTYPLLNFAKGIREQAKIEFDRCITEASKKAKEEAEKQRADALARTDISMLLNQSAALLCQNSFDVPRTKMMAELSLLRQSFLHVSNASNRSNRLTSKYDDEKSHSVPIAEMGKYQNTAASARFTPLRDPLQTDDEIKARSNRDPFGNPYADTSKPATAGGNAGGDKDEVANEASMLAKGSVAGGPAARRAPASFSPSGVPRRKLRRRAALSPSPSPSPVSSPAPPDSPRLSPAVVGDDDMSDAGSDVSSFSNASSGGESVASSASSNESWGRFHHALVRGRGKRRRARALVRPPVVTVDALSREDMSYDGLIGRLKEMVISAVEAELVEQEELARIKAAERDTPKVSVGSPGGSDSSTLAAASPTESAGKKRILDDGPNDGQKKRIKVEKAADNPTEPAMQSFVKRSRPDPRLRFFSERQDSTHVATLPSASAPPPAPSTTAIPIPAATLASSLDLKNLQGFASSHIAETLAKLLGQKAKAEPSPTSPAQEQSPTDNQSPPPDAPKEYDTRPLPKAPAAAEIRKDAPAITAPNRKIDPRAAVIRNA
ncbi:hypothetical protein DFJ73DRAFT_793806, partial [Zopfochytrium polystomum]